MYLHQDKESFNRLVHTVALRLNIDDEIVEKDYYLVLFLKKLVALEDSNFQFIFKGGSSLSKCYHLINRFSEDIDITSNGPLPKRKKDKKVYFSKISEVCSHLGLTIIDEDNVPFWRHLVRYYVDYSRQMDGNKTGKNLLIETSFYEEVNEFEQKEIVSLIGEEIIRSNSLVEATKYELEPFIVNVQRIDRTLIDKVFALCDYYLSKDYDKRSRHIYDIYKILELNLVSLDADFKKLFHRVYISRKNCDNPMCLSAKGDYKISELINEIVQSNVFRSDYNLISNGLIYDNVSYNQAVGALKFLASSGCFD